MATTYLTPGVYVEEVDSGTKPIEGVGTAVAAFVGITESGPTGKATLVTSWGQYVDTFGEFVPGAYTPHSIYGYFANGGGTCFVVRVNSDPEGAAAEPIPVAELSARGGEKAPSIKALAKGSGADAEGITVQITDADDDTFNVTVKRGLDEEKFDGLSLGKGAKNVFDVVNKQSKIVTLEELKITGLSLAERAPEPGTFPLAANATQAAAVATMDASPASYEGKVADRSGLGGLEAIDEITMVVTPDVMAAYEAGALDMDGVKAIQVAVIGHCERMGDRVAILDTPPGMNVQEASEWRMNTAGYDSNYAALYYPWIQVADPTPGAASPTIMVPPSGHMAGIWARNDDERGVHKAPANEVIRGAIGLELNVTHNEQGILNPNGVNCIRSFAGRGIRVWGARTLSSDASWRYINVRRLFNFVEKSIEGGTQWVVFEPNDYALWQKVKRDISGFLKRVWMSGALFGATPDQAFFVKCDEENNPQETRDAGQLFVDIGIAPVKPAEFVIFRIGQYAPEV